MRIAVYPVEILAYVTKSRAIVTEVVWQAGKEICVKMVNIGMQTLYLSNIIFLSFSGSNISFCFITKIAKIKRLSIPLDIFTKVE